MIGRLDEVVVDCHDPILLAEFWQRMLGGYIVRQSHEWVALEPPTGITVSFQLVPEHKQGKNRVHLDIDVGDLLEAIAATVAAGATVIGAPVYDELGGFQVM
ncbi:MAG: VOC family protein, partial [Actinomycetota bacterium]|nr:VOC family protein [Actinomycetota bacterium]